MHQRAGKTDEDNFCDYIDVWIDTRRIRAPKIQIVFQILQSDSLQSFVKKFSFLRLIFEMSNF